jgi:hypothetical protein
MSFTMKTKTLRALACLPALALLPTLPAFAVDAPAKLEAGVAEARGDAAKMALRELDAEIDQVDAMIDNAPTPEEKAAAKARMDVLKERRSELRKTYVKANYDELKADVRAEGNKFKAWTKRTFTRDPADKAADEVRDATRDARRDARRAGDEAADEARDAARDANRATRRASDNLADASRDAARDANREVRRAGDNTYAAVGSAGAAMDLAAYKARPTDTNKEEMKAAIKALEKRIDELDDRADEMPRGPDRDAAKRRVEALEDRKDEIEKNFTKARFDSLIDDVQSEWNDIRR